MAEPQSLALTAFDAMGSMIFKPVGLAIAAPLSTLFGIENLLVILAGVTDAAVLLPLLDPTVRHMSYQGELNLSPQ